MTDIYDVIQAFADGEPVDPQELDRALADREGRSHLIDVLVLRGFANGPGLSSSATAATPARSAGRSLRWLSIAALITVVASIGGYVAGERRASRQRNDLAAVNNPAGELAPATAAPAPTKVIRFEPGVDWTERGGGH